MLQMALAASLTQIHMSLARVGAPLTTLSIMEKQLRLLRQAFKQPFTFSLHFSPNTG